MRRVLAAFLRSRSGATAIEYCLIAGVVSLAIVTGASLIGTNVGSKFTAASNGLH